MMVFSDVGLIVAALLIAFYLRFTIGQGDQSGLNYPLLTLGIAAAWISLLWLNRCYEPRLLGVGGEEFRRVIVTSFFLFGTIAIVSYSFKLELARGLVAIALPLGLTMLLIGRLGVRSWIHRQRRRGLLLHRVLVIGDVGRASRVSAMLRDDPNAGFRPIGIAVPPSQLDVVVGGVAATVVGSANQVPELCSAYGVDTIAVTSSSELGPDYVRELSWRLEGQPIDLILAPSMTEVAGPRIAIRPVAGLPLMYVDEPTFRGAPRVIKRGIDIFASGIGLVVLSPFLLAVGIAIRATSQGPVMFRQSRIGVDGKAFRIWKFRTMENDADLRLVETLEASGKTLNPLFKLQDDPRVTPLGRVLRRYSIDEIPQLLNVLSGQMSLVGPRPQRAEEVEAYQAHEHRRLMIRPGMTGLWQVSGRSTKSWSEAVRLDLYYVENWSLSLDLTILLRTLLAVLRGEGAY
jgi:exopolysaccharide biosynthesis polyprenyl glycosylphosphotransferase